MNAGGRVNFSGIAARRKKDGLKSGRGARIDREQRRGAIFLASWREDFEAFVRQLDGADVYVTIDLDCLRNEEAITNWENGRFSADDVAWALQELRAANRIVGGDICGAFSPPKYARWKQAFRRGMGSSENRAAQF